MLRSQRVWLVPAALTVLGFGSSATKVSAQTTYPFQATYDILTESEPITPDVSKVTVTGESADAPYGLTKLMSMSYARLDPNTGVTTAGPDAVAFGLDGLPSFTDVWSGSGNDQLFGTSISTAVADLTNLTASVDGTETITGGSGKFSGATGTLSIIDTYKLSPDPTAPLIGKTVVNGTIKTPQSVPEPENTMTLVGMGVLGVSFLLRRRSLEVAE